MIDNQRMQTSYVIIKHGSFEDFPKIDLEIFTNEGATTASKAWTNAKKEILKKITDKNKPTNEKATF